MDWHKSSTIVESRYDIVEVRLWKMSISITMMACMKFIYITYHRHHFWKYFLNKLQIGTSWRQMAYYSISSSQIRQRFFKSIMLQLSGEKDLFHFYTKTIYEEQNFKSFILYLFINLVDVYISNKNEKADEQYYLPTTRE